MNSDSCIDDASPILCFFKWTFVIHLLSMKAFPWNNEDRTGSKQLGDHPAMVDFVLVLSSSPKNHKGELLCWWKLITLTKLFRWWEAQLGNLWLPGQEGHRSPFHAACGKTPWMAAGPMSHLSSGLISLSCFMSWPNSATPWALPRVWTYIIMGFFPVENFYNNNMNFFSFCTHVKFLSPLLVFFLSSNFSSQINTSRLLTSLPPLGEACLCGEDVELGLTSSELDSPYDPRQINHLLCSSFGSPNVWLSPCSTG